MSTPEGWRSVRLEEVADIVGGSTPSRANGEYWDGDIPWLTPTDLPTPGDGIADVYTTREHITGLGLAESSAQVLPVGSVLFSSRATIGKIGVSRVPLATNQGFANFIPRQCIDSRFLAYTLFHHTDDIARLAGSTTFKEVSKGNLKPYHIAMPPLPEQRRVVALLDRAAALLQKQLEVDTQRRRFVSDLFYRSFGYPTVASGPWPTRRIGDVLADIQYGTSNRSNDQGRGTVVIRMNNITEVGTLDLSVIKYVETSEKERTSLLLKRGDLLFNRTNSAELVGKTGLWRGGVEAVAASYLIRLRVKEECVLPEYLWAFMNTPFMKKALSLKARRAIGMANINSQELRSLPVLTPPIDLQQRFVALLSQADSVWNRSGEVAKRLKLLFRIVLHRGFSGELTADWRAASKRQAPSLY